MIFGKKKAARAAREKAAKDKAAQLSADEAARREELIALESAPRRASAREVAVRSPFGFGFIATLGGLAAIVVGTAIGQLSTIIIYIVAALFVALGLDPVVRLLQRRKMSRSLAIGIVFSAFALLVVGLIALIVPLIARQIGEFIRALPDLLNDVEHQDWFINLSNTLGDAVDLNRLVDMGNEFIAQPGNWTNLVGGIWQAGIGVANGITATIIVLILSLYFLASLDVMKQGVYTMVPRSSRRKAIDIIEQISKSIGGYVNGMVILALINASLGFVAMTIFGVPFPGVVAVIVFFLALIPLIGSVLATILVVIIGLFGSPATALGIGIYYLIFMQIEAYLLTPRVMNRVVSVPGSLVVIGALAGGTLLGLLGALIAIPVTAAILMIVKQVIVPAQDMR